LWLVEQNNKADGVNVTPITVVASIDPELLKNLIDMEEIDANSLDDCTDVFCLPDQCSLTNSYVDDNSCLISE
jgi:hypothetical protein